MSLRLATDAHASRRVVDLTVRVKQYESKPSIERQQWGGNAPSWRLADGRRWRGRSGLRFVGPLKLTAQILCGDQIAMGPGKADLLEAIDQEGSISAAGRALGMSYRRAWMLVDVMNRCWADHLVESTIGGPSQGARLTALGREVLGAYRDLEASLGEASGAGMSVLTARLRAAPKAPAKLSAASHIDSSAGKSSDR